MRRERKKKSNLLKEGYDMRDLLSAQLFEAEDGLGTTNENLGATVDAIVDEAVLLQDDVTAVFFGAVAEVGPGLLGEKLVAGIKRVKEREFI